MIDQSLLDEMALTTQEYLLIVRLLGRTPTLVELGLFGALWSEHCGYKNSKPLLKRFPTSAPWVLQGPGENAGVVDIGDGLAIVFKIESHNHPSAVEPYQGAATGVGGIVRDIFTMGARPIASLNSLRFGPLTQARNRYLLGGVVGGIAGYGNCIGVPTVGGEVCFDEAYTNNPLVNAMSVGLIRAEDVITARASGPGNLLLLVGADTGRDGIHGCSGLASRELSDETAEQRPTVQVGNPFLEKCLIEACLELRQSEYVVGMQDLGAAGITSSFVEAASRGGVGVELDIRRVPRREENMTPYEVMLSESQERMLVVVKKGFEDKVKAVFERWDLHSDVVGFVTDDARVRVRDGQEVVADVPVEALMEPPTYVREGVESAVVRERRERDLSQLPLPKDGNAVLLRLLASPTIASKEWVYRQYDHMNMTNTLLAPGAADAAVLRIKGTEKAIALCTDGNGRYGYLDPHRGGAIAVAEAFRNLACVGARPLAITNCLNFGNPEKAEIYFQLSEAIDGMAETCRHFGVPVVSGNVSLYNETRGEAVLPTPVVGALGLLEQAERRTGQGFRREGDLIVILGPLGQELGGSEYLCLEQGEIVGQPPLLDLRLEAGVQECCRQAVVEGLAHSAHDCSEGGLAVALAESCLAGGLGARCEVPAEGRWDGQLFGESQSRILLSLAAADLPRLTEIAERLDVPLRLLGQVGGGRLVIDPWIDLPLSELDDAWRHAIPRLLAGSQGS
ncbi:MAG: phosphoribosylformylglycinamidine synthase subunit PurL [Chloroflexi bacterium]|nr:phosphoribosylformylglycinamidine synthase subunit PurL [Chloroflexota bacterium]MCL5107652.1 phosphoribosylformylglycinamidine synthase subunit PurL [Chloroflexota bacterium]